MKVIALGASSAFSAGKPIYDNISKKKLFEPQWQSNFLIEFNQPNIRNGESPYRLLLDIGSDIKNSLAYQEMNFNMIDGVHITHCHNDHIGGIEGLGLSTFFNPFYSKKKSEWCSNKGVINRILKVGLLGLYRMPDGMKPEVYGHKDVLRDLWKTAKQGFNTIQGVLYNNFEIFFTKKLLTVNSKNMHFVDGDKTWEGIIVKSKHVLAGNKPMPSYGIMFISSKGEKIFFPSDSQIVTKSDSNYHYYKEADVIFADCETSPFKSGIHAHEKEHREIDDCITKKEILYHYQTEPNNIDGKFKGVAKIGDVWEF